MYKKLTQTAVLAAICIVLTLTNVGFIPTPFFKITFVHLPVIFGTLYIGKKEGIILGLVFGLCSLYSNVTTPGVLSPLFYNPLVSILPRVMIPVVVIGVSNLLKNAPRNMNIAVSAFAGSLTNTVLVLGMIFVIYAQRYMELLHIAGGRWGVFLALGTTALTQGMAEAVIVTLFTMILMRVLKADIATIGEKKTA